MSAFERSEDPVSVDRPPAAGADDASLDAQAHAVLEGSGDPDLLAALGSPLGIVQAAAARLLGAGGPVTDEVLDRLDGVARSAPEETARAEAAYALGRLGDQRGRTIGFPTANLMLDPACRLRHGIYAVRVGIDGQRHDGVASFGRRPMFATPAPLLEVFLFDFAGDLYGRTLDVAFIAWIREEMTFAGIDQLVGQMAEDSRRARAALAAAPDAFPPLGALPA